MRRPLLIIILLSLCALVAGRAVFAAPDAQSQKPVIAQPEQDANVRGVVQIVGSATNPQFQRYELYYGPYPVPSDNSWIFIGDAHYQQQALGLLGTWTTSALPDGPYALRVRVVKTDGNYIDSDLRRVTVANHRAADTPTPAATEQSVPTTVPTPLPPTPTIRVALPTLQTPKAAATAAPQASATPLLGAGTSQTSGSASAIAGQLVDVARLRDAVVKSATYTVGLFVAIGLFFGVKALLVWLWNKVRP